MSYVISYNKNIITLLEGSNIIDTQELLSENNSVEISNRLAIIQACYLAFKHKVLVFSMEGWCEQTKTFIKKMFSNSFPFKFTHAKYTIQNWLNYTQNVISNIKEFLNIKTGEKALKTCLDNNITFLFAGISRIFLEDSNAINITISNNVKSSNIMKFLTYKEDKNLLDHLGQYNLFTDSSVKYTDKRVTVASVIVDQLNQPISMFRQVLDYETYQDNNNAEIYSIYKGLQLASSMGITDLKIFTDSDCAVDLLSQYTPAYCSHFSDSIHLVANHAQMIEKCSITHVKRKYNTIADSLTHF